MKLPKTFIGITNFKWFVKEIVAMYSNEDSYFSKKRFESGIAFFFALGTSACFIYKRRDVISVAEFVWILSIWLLVAGYVVSQIQKEKKEDTPPQQPADANKQA